MWWQRLGTWLLAKDQRAYIVCLLASLAAACGMPLVNCVSGFVVAMLTWYKGARAGLLVLLWALTPFLALSLASIDIRELMLLQLLLIWLFVLCWRSQRLQMNYLFWLCLLLGSLTVIVFHVYAAVPLVVFWKKFIHQQMALWMQLAASSDATVQAQLQARLDQSAPYMTGLMVSASLLGALIMAMYGLLWQRKLMKLPVSMNMPLFRVSRWHLWAPILVFVVSAASLYGLGLGSWKPLGLTWQAGRAALIDVAPIFMLLYAALGLLLLHALCPKGSARRWWLYAAYGLLFVVTPYALGLLMVLVLVDSVVGLRQNILKVSSS